MALPTAPETMTVTPTMDGANVVYSIVGADPVVTDYIYVLDGGDPVSLGDTGASFTLTGLKQGSRHEIGVAAVNADGTGPFNEKAFVTMDNITDNPDGWDDPTWYAANGGRTPNGKPPGSGNLDFNDPDD